MDRNGQETVLVSLNQYQPYQNISLYLTSLNLLTDDLTEPVSVGKGELGKAAPQRCYKHPYCRLLTAIYILVSLSSDKCRPTYCKSLLRKNHLLNVNTLNVGGHSEKFYINAINRLFQKHSVSLFVGICVPYHVTYQCVRTISAYIRKCAYVSFPCRFINESL